MRKAVFLDRDGTIIVDKGYAFDPKSIAFVDGAVEALQRLQTSGYLLVVVTNQSGVARGLFTEEQLNVSHAELLSLLKKQGVSIDGVYYCPHYAGGSVEKYAFECACRKPKTKLFFDAARDLEIDFNGSYAVGDRERDCVIALQTACLGCVIGQTTGLQSGLKGFASWAECVDYILGGEQ